MNDPIAAARRWLGQLSEDVDQNHLQQGRRDEILVQLKFLGRNASVVKTLYDNTGFKVLGHYAFGNYPRTTSREALRCIANALLLVPSTQETFGDLGHAPKAAESYKLQDNLDEFLLARILFLMTYTKTFDLSALVEEHDLGHSIASHIKRHADSPFVRGKTEVDAITLSLAYHSSSTKQSRHF
jgi:Guanine nucleotide exchange factor synembryn